MHAAPQFIRNVLKVTPYDWLIVAHQSALSLGPSATDCVLIEFQVTKVNSLIVPITFVIIPVPDPFSVCLPLTVYPALGRLSWKWLSNQIWWIVQGFVRTSCPSIAFCWCPSTNLGSWHRARALAPEVVLGHRARARALV